MVGIAETMTFTLLPRSREAHPSLDLASFRFVGFALFFFLALAILFIKASQNFVRNIKGGLKVHQPIPAIEAYDINCESIAKICSFSLDRIPALYASRASAK